jgi:hypothetical protein
MLCGAAAWTAHSCTPNVWASITWPPLCLTLLSRKEIKRGQPVTAALVDEAFVYRSVRRHSLRHLCGLDCQCARCRGGDLYGCRVNPAGPCTACSFRFTRFGGGEWRCVACGACERRLNRDELPGLMAAKSDAMAEEVARLGAVHVASRAPDAPPPYHLLLPLQRLAAEAEAAFGACSGVVSEATLLLSQVHDSVAEQAGRSAGGALQRNRTTRQWPATAPRDSVTLHARAAQVAFDNVRIAECEAAGCFGRGGARCAAERHSVLGGRALDVARGRSPPATRRATC